MQLELSDEFFSRNVRLPKDAGKRTSFDFPVIWDNTTNSTPSHDDMAAALADNGKAETLKSSNSFSS